MLDYKIERATIVDGTGRPAVRGDVGVRDGRIVAVGAVDEPAARTFDADGLVVAPGFVDPHTHYDAQLFWDPFATPSNVHGVTTVVGGNCGFTLAPLKAEDADYIRRMMAKVEGMPLAALENGVDWSWETFAEYLDAVSGGIAVNAGFMVGHCALRRYVMGADAIGNEATPEQLDAMVRVLHESLDAGGLGLSTTLSSTHSDGDGQPVASRHASARGADRPVPGSRRARGDDPRRDRAGLPQHLQRRGDRPPRGHVGGCPPTDQLERADGGLAGARTGDPPAGGVEHRTAGRWAHRGAHHARARPHEHELPQLLRPQHDPRVGTDPRTAHPRAHREAARSRCQAGDDGQGEEPGSRGVPPSRRFPALRDR